MSQKQRIAKCQPQHWVSLDCGSDRIRLGGPVPRPPQRGLCQQPLVGVSQGEHRHSSCHPLPHRRQVACVRQDQWHHESGAASPLRSRRSQPPSGGGAFLPIPRSSGPSGAKPQQTIRCVAFSGDGRSCQPLQNPFDGTLCTTTDHLSCAIPCRQNLQDRKSRLARAASPDNRDPQQQQETSRGNRRGPWVVLTSLRPSLECRIRHPRTLASPHLSGYPTNVM